MSTLQERRTIAMAGMVEDDGRLDFAGRVFLQPIAAPSVLGLFGFAGATLMVGANLAGWYGDAKTPLVLFPFAAIFGGVAQFAAGMWAYRARDALATAMHGMWGSFWVGWGILQLLFATHVLTPAAPTAHDPAFAFWFVALAAITWSGAAAALAEGLGLFGVLGTLAAGSTLAAIGFWLGSTGWQHTAGWVFVFSAGIAWYVATAMMLAATSGRTILPLFKYAAEANKPGAKRHAPIEIPWAEPGIKQGQ